MADLNFNNNNTMRQTLRAAPTRLNKSRLRYNFEQSEGQRLAEVFYPSKYLPVQFQDTTTEDWVVITKGKVCSAIGLPEYIYTLTVADGGIYGAADASGTLPNPTASGDIPVYRDRNGTTVKANMDSSFWGYNETVNGLLVPCNGGMDRVTAASYEYQANDVTAGTYSPDGDLAAAAELIAGTLASGNIPIGVAMYDIYQDIRGRNLNYGMWDKWGLLSDYFVTVPFVREGHGGVAYDTNMNSEATLDDSAAVWALHDLTYMTIPSGWYARTGATIRSDCRGNYVIQNAFDTEAEVSGVNITSQTVGRLVTLDSRYPKDLLDYVDTYGGSQMAGTDTGGIPYWLFIFAFNYLTATATIAPTIANIQEAVRAGRFGMARIQLHIN